MSGSKLLVLYDEVAVQDVAIKQQLNSLAQQRWLYLLNFLDAHQIVEAVQKLKVQDHTGEMTRKLNNILGK